MERNRREEGDGVGRGSPPLLSIGVPVFNGEDHLAQALESALSQDYDNLEIVISDNASTDGTAAICRRFAAADPRVRYYRNPVNVGWVNNFHKALTLAQGRYFTWLAHDDLFARNDAVKVAADYLERHPDVVLCASALTFFDQVVSRVRGTLSLASIHPDAPWRKARRELFRWSRQTLELCYGIYGMYRRSELLTIPFVESTGKGRLVTLPEYHILLALGARGRIVALPEILRRFRYRPGSTGNQMCGSLSGLGQLLFQMRTKADIIRNAWEARLPLAEKAELLLQAGANFFPGNFSAFFSYPTMSRTLRREVKGLRKAAKERQELIEVLQKAIAERRAILHSLRSAG